MHLSAYIRPEYSGSAAAGSVFHCISTVQPHKYRDTKDAEKTQSAQRNASIAYHVLLCVLRAFSASSVSLHYYMPQIYIQYLSSIISQKQSL